MIIECLEELLNLTALLLGQYRAVLWDKSNFACDDGPSILRKPFGDSVDCPAVGQKPCTSNTLGNVIILIVAKRLDFVSAGLDPGRLKVRVSVWVISLDDPSVIKKEFIASGGAELAFAK